MAYIGVQPAEAYTSFAVQHFTTSATTSYTLDNSVANENEIALFINNVRQQPGSSYAYTASGTTLTLSAATTTSDTMYCVFIGKAVQTVTPTLPIANFSSTGIDDNATSTAITIDSSGNVGIGTSSPSEELEISASVPTIRFTDTTTNAYFHLLGRDDGGVQFQADQGNSQANTVMTFQIDGSEKMRISSDGLHIGGTGSANALDDYEEGTWTPSFGFSSTGPTAGETTGTGFYTKVGNMVTVWGAVSNVNVTGASGDVRIKDLPFTSKTSANLVGYMGSFGVHGNTTFTGYLNCDVQDGFNYIRPWENISGSSRDILNVANCVHGATDVYFSVSYQVN